MVQLFSFVDGRIENAVHDAFIGVMSPRTTVVSADNVFVGDVVIRTSWISPQIRIIGFVQFIDRWKWKESLVLALGYRYSATTDCIENIVSGRDSFRPYSNRFIKACLLRS